MVEYVYRVNCTTGEWPDETTHLVAIFLDEKKSVEWCKKVIKDNNILEKRVEEIYRRGMPYRKGEPYEMQVIKCSLNIEDEWKTIYDCSIINNETTENVKYTPSYDTNTNKNNLLKYVYVVNSIHGKGVFGYLTSPSIYVEEKSAIERCEQIIKDTQWALEYYMEVPLDIYMKHINTFEKHSKSKYGYIWCDKLGYSAYEWEDAHKRFISNTASYQIQIVKYPIEDVVEGTFEIIHKRTISFPERSILSTKKN